MILLSEDWSLFKWRVMFFSEGRYLGNNNKKQQQQPQNDDWCVLKKKTFLKNNLIRKANFILKYIGGKKNDDLLKNNKGKMCQTNMKPSSVV